MSKELVRPGWDTVRMAYGGAFADYDSRGCPTSLFKWATEFGHGPLVRTQLRDERGREATVSTIFLGTFGLLYETAIFMRGTRMYRHHTLKEARGFHHDAVTLAMKWGYRVARHEEGQR